MLVKFKVGTLEARVRMATVPRIGDTVTIQGESYEVAKIKWDISATNNEQNVTVFIRRLQGSAKE